MKLTKKTTCKELADHIMKKYGAVENQTLAIIWETMDAAGDTPVGEHIDTVKAWECWLASGGRLPRWNNDVGWTY